MAKLHDYNREKNHGFTMIELMIIIGILSILSAISIINYINYIARSQAVAAFSEISLPKPTIDLRVLTGISKNIEGSNDDIATEFGLPSSETKRCSIAIYIETSGAATVTCIIKGNLKVNGYVIQLVRDADTNQGSTGKWVCNSNLDTTVRPQTCTGTYTP